MSVMSKRKRTLSGFVGDSVTIISSPTLGGVLSTLISTVASPTLDHTSVAVIVVLIVFPSASLGSSLVNVEHL